MADRQNTQSRALGAKEVRSSRGGRVTSHAAVVTRVWSICVDFCRIVSASEQKSVASICRLLYAAQRGIILDPWPQPTSSRREHVARCDSNSIAR